MYISADQMEAMMYLNLKTFYHLDSFLSSMATANMFEKVSLAMKDNDLLLLQDLHRKYLEKIREMGAWPSGSMGAWPSG